MSDTQTHCSHRFIIAAASAGATGHRKRVNWRRGQAERDEGTRGEKTNWLLQLAKICPKAPVRARSAAEANRVTPGNADISTEQLC